MSVCDPDEPFVFGVSNSCDPTGRMGALFAFTSTSIPTLLIDGPSPIGADLVLVAVLSSWGFSFVRSSCACWACTGTGLGDVGKGKYVAFSFSSLVVRLTGILSLLDIMDWTRQITLNKLHKLFLITVTITPVWDLKISAQITKNK